MKQKALLHVGILWLSSAVAIAVVGGQVGAYALDAQISRFLSSYLLITLDEPMFSDASGIVNDRESIANVGRKINAAIEPMIERRWFAGAGSCRAAVQSIDGVAIDTTLRAKRELLLEVPRNRIARAVEVGVVCDDQLWPYAVWTVVLGAVFLALYARTPLPLAGDRQRWLRALIAQGYARHEAYQQCAGIAPASGSLGDSQRLCFEALHDAATRNFAVAMRVASDPRVADLGLRGIDWLVWWVRGARGDIDTGIAVARAPDLVEIDLRHGSLRIHGVDIPVNKTPLFYYAWYAHHRLRGDGWLTNPQSNKPDKSAGQELAQLMWSCAGHAKAAAGAEEIGLKAKTLDQNRSKIKQEIVALLGESLSAPYLFDECKDPRTGRMSYRLRVPPAEVRIRL